MKTIIKKAIEGGYVIPWRVGKTEYSMEAIVCDPLFWQALGNICGWDNNNGDWIIDSRVRGGAIRPSLKIGVNFHEINL